MSISFFNASNGAEQSTTGLNGQFLFYQILMDCLLRLKSTSSDRNELIQLCKQQYKDNIEELDNIERFENEYTSEKVLHWYTKESFFYKSLNTALRTGDIHTIYLFRQFIFDMYHQLKKHQTKHKLRVYRTQMISTRELDTLKKCCGQLISINSFFSTSTTYQQALTFLDVPEDVESLEPILFEIDASPDVVIDKPFADISTFSEFSEESEVLFMLGSIFRLESAKYSRADQVSIVKMTLCNDHQHDLKDVLCHMKKQFGSGPTNLNVLGQIMWNMGKLDLAEKYLKHFSMQLPRNDPMLRKLYEDRSKIASQRGDLNKAVKLVQESMQFNKTQLDGSPCSGKAINSGGKFIRRFIS